MGRLWLTVGVLGVLAGSVHAERASCVHPEVTILPGPDAKDVPLNTSIWIFGLSNEKFRLSGGARDRMFVGGNHSDPAVPVEVVSFDHEFTLDPRREYHVDGHGIATAFTTGTTAFHQPPPAPELGVVSMTVRPQTAERMSVASVALAARFDPSAAVVRVDLEDAYGKVSYLVPATQQYLCDPGFSVAPGPVRVTVRAVDLAGNESSPVSTVVDVVVDSYVPYTGDKHLHCGLGETVLYVFGGALVFGVLVALLVISTIRHAMRPRGPGEPVSLLIAEHAARTTLRQTIVAAAIELGAMSTLFAIEHEIVACGVALFAARDLIASWSARRFIATLECIGATAELRARAFVVHLEARERWLRVSRRAIAAARRAAVPAAERR